jgi:glycosyltransferase involved in cell wall biosynthesis
MRGQGASCADRVVTRDVRRARPKVALAHHWLVGMRGGEKVLESLASLFPGAPIYTLLGSKAKINGRLSHHEWRCSPLQHLPGAISQYKKMLPLFPGAISQLKVDSSTEFLMSSDASVIKGLQCPQMTPHVCYCHSPPRYLWDLAGEYRRSAEAGNGFGRLLFDAITPYVREFDRIAAGKVTAFIANSRFVQQRIKRYYGRDSVVIHPPVDAEAFAGEYKRTGDFYLVVSQLVFYKRVDVAVAACNQLGRKLIVIGEGSERGQLEAIAGPDITFLGAQPFSVLRDHYRECRAFLFPGIEDFGITPLEAQACGTPVLAFGKGGALETVREGLTGLFFSAQTADSLADCIRNFEAIEHAFHPAVCRANAEAFSTARFEAEIKSFLESRFDSVFANCEWSG